MRVKLPLYIVLQQARWKKSKAKRTKGQFKLFYHGVDIKKNGEGIILKKEIKSVMVILLHKTTGLRNKPKEKILE